jgi:hypothetical protein
VLFDEGHSFLRRNDDGCAASFELDTPDRLVLDLTRVAILSLYLQRKEHAVNASHEVGDACDLEHATMNLEPPAADLLLKPITYPAL